MFESIAAAKPDSDQMIYLERTGDEYSWRPIPAGEPMTPLSDAGFPDAWLFHSLGWPTGQDIETQREFFDDLVAEMESSFGGADRCRWSFDEPYGPRH